MFNGKNPRTIEAQLNYAPNEAVDAFLALCEDHLGAYARVEVFTLPEDPQLKTLRIQLYKPSKFVVVEELPPNIVPIRS